MLAAYATTDYRVEHPDGSFSLRVGSRSRCLDRLLAQQGGTTWAFITAWNPFSLPLPIEQNVARQRQLEAEVSARGWVAFTGQGHGQGDWPPEPSLLILGISEADARVLAQTFRQAAIVVGNMGHPARLLMLESTDPGQFRTPASRCLSLVPGPNKIAASHAETSE